MALNVAYINHIGSIGGAERSLLELIEGVRRVGHRAVLLAPEGALLNSARTLGAETVPVDFEQVGKKDLIARPFVLHRRWTTLRTVVVTAVRESGAALIHANSLKSAIVAGRAARTLHLPLLWHVRDRLPIREPGRSVLIWAAQRNARLVLANSWYTLGAIGIRGDKGRVLPNGIPLERYRSIRENTGVRVTRIGIVGRISPEKGHDIFVRMAARLRSRYPDLRFLVIGDVFQGAVRFGQRVARMVREQDLESSFQWVPFQNDPTVIYGAIDVLVVPSRSEGFGRVVVEAMACGVPVVAAAVGGIPEIAAGSAAVSLFPSGSDGDAALAVSQLIDDSRQYKRAATDGPAAARRYSLEATIEQLLVTYRDLTDA